MRSNHQSSPLHSKSGNSLQFLNAFFSILFALLLDYFVWNGLGQDPLVSWLGAINLVAFLTYSYDKAISSTHYPRVTTGVFLLHAFTGGIVGAYLGIIVYKHQDVRQRFASWLWLFVLIPVLLVVLYIWVV